MKKLVKIMVLGVALVCLAGCGESKSNKSNEDIDAGFKEINVKEIEIDEIEIDETSVYVSDEYLKELQYNSQTNSYFGE